jgi:hypothetical protein
MWENPMREREIYYSAFRKVHYSSKTTFPAKRNTSQHKNYPNKFCLEKRAKSILLYDLFCTSFSMPIVSYMDCFIRPRKRQQKSEICLENHAQVYLDFCAKSVRLYRIVQVVRIRIVRPPTIEKSFGPKITENFPWDVRI